MHSGLNEAKTVIRNLTKSRGAPVPLQDQLKIIELFTQMSHKGHQQLIDLLLEEYGDDDGR